jgi:DNA-binding response OmpR family regulator
MLPEVSSAMYPSSNEGKKAESEAKGERVVLLAVDEPSIGQMLVRVFAKVGLKVFWVSGLAEGLSRLRESQQGIGLAFLDCHQSEAETREFCRDARAVSPGLPVLLAGGIETKNAADALAGGGVTVFVGKPYLPTELAWQLRDVLRKSAA